MKFSSGLRAAQTGWLIQASKAAMPSGLPIQPQYGALSGIHSDMKTNSRGSGEVRVQVQTIFLSKLSKHHQTYKAVIPHENMTNGTFPRQ